VLMRRLTLRNSIEGKKDVLTMRQVSVEGNKGLIRDFIVLVRLIGLGKWAHNQPQHHDKASIIAKVSESNAEFFRRSQTERLEIWNIFAVWDAENTDVVTPAEVAKTFEIMGFDAEMSHEASQNLIKLVDTDGSGMFTWRKFKALTVMTSTTRPSEALDTDMQDFFELVDVNGDGRVTVDELTASLRRMRIGLQSQDVLQLLYSHFGEAKLQVTKGEFVEWARDITAPSSARR